MRWLKAILGIILVFSLMMNLYVFFLTEDSAWPVLTNWVIPNLVIALIVSASAFIFASGLPNRKKVIWMWLSFPGYIIAMVLLLYLTFLLFVNPSTAAPVIVPLIIAGIALVTLPVVTGIFWFLLRFDERKQVQILTWIVILLLVLCIVQTGVLHYRYQYRVEQSIQQTVGVGACEKIQDLGRKDICYTHQANFYRDPSYCESVQEQRAKESCQKYCC